MKRKELKEFRNNGIEKIRKEAVDKKFEIAKSLTEIKVSKEKNLKKVKFLRHDLAQVLTILREKEIAEEESGKKPEVSSGKKENK